MTLYRGKISLEVSRPRTSLLMFAKSPPFQKIPPAVMVGLVLAILLDTVVQVTWKMALVGLPENAPAGTVVNGVLRSPLFYVAAVALVAQLFNWIRVLARTDLSFAQPITALSYITVLVVSSRFLHEAISTRKLCGIALILLGVIFISRTPSQTAKNDGDARRPSSSP